MKNDFLNYYGEHDISPVKQDISNLDMHLRRREKLYRQLGLPLMAFKNRRILEVGPGSGYNTLAMLKLGIKCDLVEPNPKGIHDMKHLFPKHNIDPKLYKIYDCEIEDFTAEYKYDIIIAEGFIHAIDNSKDIIEKLIDLLNHGGILVITYMDEVSIFIEQIKRLIANILTKDITDYEIKVKTLTKFFEEQFKKLTGMSRSVEDWVRDSMLNPAFNNSYILSIGKVIEMLPDNMEVLGTSQSMFTDYSWYKDINYNTKNNYLIQFKKKQHNLLMTNLEETMLSIEENIFLNKNIKDIRESAINYEMEHSWKDIDKIKSSLNNLFHVMGKIGEEPYKFVKETYEILDNIDKHKIDFSKYETFFYAVGRSQQYVSLVKDYFE